MAIKKGDRVKVVGSVPGYGNDLVGQYGVVVKVDRPYMLVLVDGHRWDLGMLESSLKLGRRNRLWR
jgi:hypothetical protein